MYDGSFNTDNFNIITDDQYKMLRDYTVRIKPPVKEKNGTLLRAKVISKMNYVFHVKVLLSPDGTTAAVGCDGYKNSCRRGVCVHCLAALRNAGGAGLRHFDPSGFELQETEDDARTISTGNDNGFTAAFREMPKAAPVVIAEPVLPAEPTPCDTAPAYENTADDEKPSADEYNTASIDEMTENEEAGRNDFSEGTAPAQVIASEEECEPVEIKIEIGTKLEDGEPLYWYPNNTELTLHNNVGIIGTMGTGKTQLTKSLITQLYRSSPDNFGGKPIGFLIFDYKGDYNETKTDFVKAVNARVIKPYRIPYNPFSLERRSSHMPLLPMHIASAFCTTITSIYKLGAKQSDLLLKCIIDAYQSRGIIPAQESTWKRRAPVFADVYRMYEEKTGGNVSDSLSAAMNMLNNFMIFEPDVTRTAPLSELLDGVLVVDLSGYDEKIQNLVVEITLEQFYAQMLSSGSSRLKDNFRELRTFILVDEADNFMKEGFSCVRKIMKEGREFGTGVLLSTQSLKHFASSEEDYSKYILTWVVHNVSDLKTGEIEYVFKRIKKSEVENVFSRIKGLKKHQSFVVSADGSYDIADDKPFWKLCTENL